MDHRSPLFGLSTLLVCVGLLGPWVHGAAACETRIVSQATDPGQVTVIPGTKSSTRPPIDYQGALPLPLPSVKFPGTANDPGARPEPRDNPPEISSPGGRGTGEQHPEILPPPVRR
jgi:hypothetical protein